MNGSDKTSFAIEGDSLPTNFTLISKQALLIPKPYSGNLAQDKKAELPLLVIFRATTRELESHDTPNLEQWWELLEL